MKGTTTRATYVGLDVDAKRIHVAVLAPGASRPVELSVAHEARAIGRLARKLHREASGPVVTCYEAGPTGFALQRRLEEADLTCQVIAPSLIPVKPGEHVKTDRRDARKLAELLRAGLLTVVAPPTPAEEAVRDLCRAREDTKQDLTRCRHRLSKFLLRRGLRWTAGRRAWTRTHRTWLRSLRLEHEADQDVLNAYLLAVEQHEQLAKALDEKLEAISEHEPYREPVGWLCCFRGIATITAMTIVSELYCFARFSTPRELMAYLGMTPSEHSSAEKTRRGSITKAGNAHVRRVLVESAWHCRHRPAVGATLARRRRDQPAWVIAIADKAQQRLHRRYWHLVTNGKHHNKAVVAVARELVGFIWATLHERAEAEAPAI